MCTPTLSPDAPPRLRKLIRAFLPVLVVAVAIVALISLWFCVCAWRALPELEGKISIPGLNGPVTVTRDAQGVPSINASSPEDLFFAQGYVTAQDRLWQMDITRRYASGRLSEIFGKRALETDIRQRTLMVPMIAERAAAQLPQRDRAYLQAYANGVNAYIDSHALPAEFHVLHYSPEKWTVVDSLLVGSSMSEMLNLESLETTLTREAVTSKLGPELATDLYPNESFRDHPPVPDPEEEQEATPSPATEEETHVRRGRTRHHAFNIPPALFENATDSMPLVPGSNNWVVSGAHTASGKPLLSNDMHLPLQIPNTWYEVHLTSGSFDVAGVSLPGVPFVIVGHNQRIAWGFTNVGPAVTDFYVETVNERGEYLTPWGWQKTEDHPEHISVRWGKDVDLNVKVTRHGPVVTKLIPGEKRTVALKWVLFDPAASQVPFFDVDSAQNWDQFRQAFSRLGSPGQNVVYADVDGHIGYQATGFVPVRPWAQSAGQSAPSRTDAGGSGSPAQSTATYDGLPVTGADNSHEWAGYIPYDQLPSVYDPPSGIIATANGRIAPKGYPYVVSAEWGPGYRTERIYRVLNVKSNLTSADMLSLQTDVHSDFDRFLAERFVYAIDHNPKASERAKEAGEIMRQWDGDMTTDSAAATIVTDARHELVKLLLQPKLGNSYELYRWAMAGVWLENVVLLKPERWLPPNYSDFDAVLADAVEKSTREESSRLSGLHWGATSSVYLQHPLFGGIPILKHWAGPGRNPQSGNGYTVKQVGRSFGPSERMTVDFSNMDASTLNVVTGQSGNIFSKHYLDQWKAWYMGTTYTLPFSQTAVQQRGVQRLELEPAR